MACVLSAQGKRPRVENVGDIFSKIVVVGQSPGFQEATRGRVFIGESGKILTASLKDAGFDVDSLLLANAVSCHPDKIKITKKEVDTCRELYLAPLLKQSPRKLIITLGTEAYVAVLGGNLPTMRNVRGIIRWSSEFNCYVLPTYHPAAILRRGGGKSKEKSQIEELFKEDLAKAYAFTKNGFELDLPETEPIIIEDALDFGVKLLSQQSVVVDIETDGKKYKQKDKDPFWKCNILGISFCWEEGKAYYLNLTNGVPDSAWNLIKSWLEDEGKEIIWHGGSYDRFMLKRLGVEVGGKIFDTCLVQHLLHPVRGTHGLKTIAMTELGADAWGDKIDSIVHAIGKERRIPVAEQHLGLAPLKDLAEYSCKDADYTFRLAQIFKERLKNDDLENMYYRFVAPLAAQVFRAAWKGIKIDTDIVGELEQSLQSELSRLQSDVGINLNSTKQIAHLLYEELGMTPPKKTQKGADATDEEALDMLDNPVVEKIKRYRKLSKVYSTYVTGVSNFISPQGRVHSSINISGTDTGRMACSGPNLQNVPRELRGMYVADEGYTFLEVDMSQIELRMWAAYSQDPELLKMLKEEDIHTAVASKVYKIPKGEVTPEVRRAAKSASFGACYGLGAESASKRYDLTLDEAKAFLDWFYTTFKRARAWSLSTVDHFKNTGEFRTLLGRKLLISGFDFNEDEASRRALNYPEQSLACDVTNYQFLRVMHRARVNNMEMIPLMQLHDAWLWEVPEDKAEKWLPLVVSWMSLPVPRVNVPLAAEGKIGKVWCQPVDVAALLQGKGEDF